MTSKNTKELTSKTKNKILVLGLMLVVLVGIFGLINKVEAAPSCWYKGGIYGSNLGITPITDEAKCIAVGGAWGESAATSQGTLSGTNAPTNPNPDPNPSSTEVTVQKTSEPKKNDCSFWDGNLVDCTASLLARIAWIIMSIMSWLLWLAGVLLNYVIKETIVTMKEGVDKMTGINIGWKVIRDVMNIGFIFLLVYEGIMMIIGQSGKDKVKKYIFSIVLAALLINFSLFFTKVLIDASNIITIGLYNSIIDSSSKATVTGNELTTDTVIKRPIEGISAPFMSALKLQQLYGGNSFENISNAVGGGTNMLLFFLMGAVLFLILTFVFFAIAMMFIVRYITLIILLMTSPIAYMGSAIPGMSQYSKQWWDSLKGQLLFAPIYMLITMIVLKLIGSDGFIKTDGADWSGFVTGTANAVASGATTNSTMSLLLNFAVIIGLAIASLVIAKSTSTKGSKFIGQATGKLTEFAGGVAMGGASKFGRNTFGRAGNAVSNSEYLKDRASKGGVGGFFAKTALKTGTKTATSSFDVRSTGKFQDLAKMSGVDFGKGTDAKKVSFQKTLEEKAKAEADFAKTLKPTDDVMRTKETEQEKLKEEQETAKSSLESSEKKIKDLKEKEKKLRERVNKAKTFEEREEIKKQIDSTEELIKTEEGGLGALKKASEEASKAATSHEKEMKAIFTDRVSAYAETFEKESRMWRYTKNAFKIPLSNMSSVTPTTAGDNREIARKIKGVLKEKKKFTKEALKEFGLDVEDDKNEKEKGDAGEQKEKPTEEKTEEPKTT